MYLSNVTRKLAQRRDALAVGQGACARRHNRSAHGRSDIGRSAPLRVGRHGRGRIEFHGRDRALLKVHRAGQQRNSGQEYSTAQEHLLHGHFNQKWSRKSN